MNNKSSEFIGLRLSWQRADAGGEGRGQNLNFLILADVWAKSLKYVYCVVSKGDPWGVSAAHRKSGPSMLPAGA